MSGSSKIIIGIVIIIFLIAIGIGSYYLYRLIQKRKQNQNQNNIDSDKDSDDDDNTCLETTKPNCVDSLGNSCLAQCTTSTREWSCPVKCCDLNQKVESNGCSINDQQCVVDSSDSSKYNWSCKCNNVISNNPSQDNCLSLYGPFSVAYCSELNNDWSCSCYGNQLTDDVKSMCKVYGDKSTLICSSITQNWDCDCDGKTLNDPNNINCNQLGSTYQCISSKTNPDELYWTCECKNELMEDNESCDSNEMLVCNNDSGSSGWTCQVPDCSSISEKPLCLNDLEPTCVFDLDGNPSYKCLGLTCSNNLDCSSKIGFYLLTTNDSNLNPDYYKNRALYSIYCTTADDIGSCMSQIDNNVTTYLTPDYIESTCYPSSSIQDTNYCTRISCPKPLSIHNQTANGDLLAGCLSPNNLMFNDSTSLSNSLSTLSVFSSKLSTYFSFDNGYMNYGSAFIFFPINKNKKWDKTNGQMHWVTIAGVGYPYLTSDAFSKSPLISSSIGNLLIRIYPFQNFHPFLMWRMVPHAYGWGTTKDSSSKTVNQNYFSQTTHGRDSNQSFKNPTNTHFFILMHMSSMLYVNTYGCHATSSDNGRGCNVDANGNSSNYLPLTKLTCDQYNFYYNFMQKGTSFDWTSKKYDNSNPFRSSGAISTSNMGIFSKGVSHNNLLTIYGIDSSQTHELNPCDYSVSTPTDNLDIDKPSEFNLNCGAYLSSPSLNDNARVNYITVPSIWAPGSRLQMFHRDGENSNGNSVQSGTLFYLLNLSTIDKQTQINGLSFFQKYADSNPNLIPFVQYPESFRNENTTIFAYNKPTNYFLAPIQYSLLVPTTTDDKSTCLKYRMTVFILLYTWNEDLTDWYLTGELLHNTDDQICYTQILTTTNNNPFDFNSQYKTIGQWFITSYFPLNDFNQKLTQSFKIQSSPSEWSIHLSYYYQSKEYFIIPNTTTTYQNTENTFSINTTTEMPSTMHQVTSNGHIYMLINESIYFLAVNNNPTKLTLNNPTNLFYINLIAYTTSSNSSDLPFYCPMFCIFYQYSSSSDNPCN